MKQRIIKIVSKFNREKPISKTKVQSKLEKRKKFKKERFERHWNTLIQQQRILKCNKSEKESLYYWNDIHDHSTDKEDSHDCEDKVENMTFSERMRRKRQSCSDSNKLRTEKNREIDLDEEIKRLEAELNNNDNSSDSDSNDDEDDDEDDNFDDATNINNHGIICLSSLSDQKISSLDKTLLPTNKRKRLKAIDEEEHSKKKKQTHGSGLKDAVQELLKGYVARSSHKIPFYCRVCAIQSTNIQEFNQHKQTALHKRAVQVERKACYCRLCQKQFTSPIQMKEHLSSKPHRDKMDYVKSKQRQRKTVETISLQTSKRQWC